MKDQTQEIGHRIAERRRAAGLTQGALAEKAGVSVKTIQGVEQGRTSPDLRTLVEVARVLDAPLDALTGGVTADPKAVDALIRRIEKDLRALSPTMLDHVAAIVLALRSK